MEDTFCWVMLREARYLNELIDEKKNNLATLGTLKTFNTKLEGEEEKRGTDHFILKTIFKRFSVLLDNLIFLNKTFQPFSYYIN